MESFGYWKCEIPSWLTTNTFRGATGVDGGFGATTGDVVDAPTEGTKRGLTETLVRDAIVAALLVAVIIALAIIIPVTIEPPADPTSTTYNPRPEWYFLFFFQFLKLFPGWMEPIAAAIIPLLALIVLALVPFLDRGLERRWSRRKPIIGVGVVAVLVLIALEVAGATSAPAIPAGEETLLVQTGREVYKEINCGYCHSIGGLGGNIGPALSDTGSRLSDEELITYLQNPHAMVPATLHPKLLFTDEELEALVAYLLTLGAPVSYSAEAPVLFGEHCASCHIIDGKGGELGPDLSTVGERRTINFIEAFTADPKSVLPGVGMPTFHDVLAPEQIRDIAAYLSSLRGETPAVLIPHELEGRSSCLACHESGIGEATQVPADHTGRGNETCLNCHSTE